MEVTENRSLRLNLQVIRDRLNSCQLKRLRSFYRCQDQTVKDLALFEFMYGTSARVAEVVRLSSKMLISR